MTKKTFLLICVLTLVGCSYGQDYLANPQQLLQDPHFADYKQRRDALESSYLRKEITYAEYIERRDTLDAQYDKEVQKRNAVIMSTE